MWVIEVIKRIPHNLWSSSLLMSQEKQREPPVFQHVEGAAFLEILKDPSRIKTDS